MLRDRQACSRSKSEVSDRGLSTYQPLLLGQDGFQHTENALDLVDVTVLSALNFLWVVEREPCRLTEVRTLSRRLEEQPLELNVLVVGACDRNLVVRVILVDEVQNDGARFPD